MSVPVERLESFVGSALGLVPEPIARIVVDALPQIRLEEGPKLGERLATIPPEERRWRGGIKPAALSLTDMLDGFWARLIGTTDHGRDLDRKGDWGFVEPQEEARFENGELSPVYYWLDVGREKGMAGLRWWGERNDKNLKSKESSRQKTFIKMSTNSAAHTPLSLHRDLMEWGDSMGTNLSLTGLLETAFDYMKKDEPTETSVARNSAARRISAGPRERIAAFIHEKAPNITPSKLTKWGKLMVEGASALAVARPDHPAAATTLYTAGSLVDTIDGALARLKGEDGLEGMIEDVEADLQQQIVSLAALSIIARKRGNKVAATNYALAAMLTPLSALTRAQAESQGHIVAEGGIGTRVGRGIIAGVGMGMNKHRETSNIASAMLLSSTFNTVRERLDVVENGAESTYSIGTNTDPEFMDEAQQRANAINRYALLGVSIGIVLLSESGFHSFRTHISRGVSDPVEMPAENDAQH